MEKLDCKEQFEKDLFRRFPELMPAREEIFNAYFILKNCFFKSGTVFICGNGGSAADSEHIAGELGKGFLLKRPLSNEMKAQMNQNLGENMDDISGKLQRGLRCVPLTGQIALSTAFLNDVDPNLVFAQQIFSLARPEDVVIGITTSGNAQNVMAAFKVAGGLGLKRILLTGEKGGLCRKYADCSICAPSSVTFRVQEYHLPIYHTLCMMLEDHFFGAGE